MKNNMLALFSLSYYDGLNSTHQIPWIILNVIC
jgi:hypothetical protein